MLSSLQKDTVENLLRETAETLILPRWKQLKQNEIETKTGPNDFVTVADTESEARLVPLLRDILPGSLVIGEESVSRNEVDMAALLAQEDDPVWIIDPVDGTHNFVHGSDKFGMIVALIYKGQTVHGWIYDIPGNKFAYASRGGGTTYDGQYIRFKDQVIRLDQMKGYLGRKFIPQRFTTHFQQKLDALYDVNTLGACAHEYINILRGEAAFAMYSRTKPWDHAAGTLMVEEAGGSAIRWNGLNYAPDAGFGLIAATGENLARTLHKHFIESLPQELKHHVRYEP